MAISKALRAEILRRDNYACRYCGGRAPDVRLTIDHVTPVAHGGTDLPTNLVAACADCNAGKAAIPANAEVVGDVAQDALRWTRAIEESATIIAAEQDKRDGYRAIFEYEWASWNSGSSRIPIPKPSNWPDTIDRFAQMGLSVAQLCDAVDIAMRATHVPPRNTFKYFCGVGWRKITALQQMASDMLATEDDS